MAFVWSEEAISRLKALHEKGLSGSELARALGSGLTRSAIFGKLHRLGLTGAKSAETGRLVSRLAALTLRDGSARGAAPGAVTPGYGPMKFNFARQGRHASARLGGGRVAGCFPPGIRWAAASPFAANPAA